MIFRKRPTAASGGVDFDHNHNDIKFVVLLAALRLLLASARMHTRPLREDEDESNNDRCENA